MGIRYEIRTTNGISRLYVIKKKRDNLMMAIESEELLERGTHKDCVSIMKLHVSDGEHFTTVTEKYNSEGIKQ